MMPMPLCNLDSSGEEINAILIDSAVYLCLEKRWFTRPGKWFHQKRRREVAGGIEMMDIGLPELLIIAVLVILLFGVGRIGKVGGELGRGIREFRSALKEGEPGEQTPTPATSAPAAPASENKPVA